MHDHFMFVLFFHQITFRPAWPVALDRVFPLPLELRKTKTKTTSISMFPFLFSICIPLVTCRFVSLVAFPLTIATMMR